ncbi:hypothetical protein V5799_002701 [Amblyomma americanum]|uniref:Organic cation/carnitine transporter n=1 Tax=Amblyomma americanum TaxID=6943 RepID=A0AAQ4DB29_AMBAM
MDVTSVIGDYGKFQRNVYLFCLLRGAPNGLHLVIYSFFLPAVEHWCARPEGLAGNLTTEQWKAMMLPNSSSGADAAMLRSSRCRTFDFEVSGDGLPVLGDTAVPCQRWEYGQSYYRSSLVQERTYLTDSVPMGVLAGIACLASLLMFVLPETFRVTLPDTIRESKQLGKSRTVEKQGTSNDTTEEAKLRLPLAEVACVADGVDVKHGVP